MATPLKLLIVDDDDVDRMSLKRTLTTAGVVADVVEAEGAQEALEELRKGAFDCVILDFQLPGADGLQVLHSIRASGIRTPVIVLTGQGDEQTAVELMKAGAADYMGKGHLSPERLSRSLRHALALFRSEEARRQLLEREKLAREEAQAANRAKDEFLATLSHELRTPLNAILGWVRLMSSGSLDVATTERALEIIERNTRLQAQLIEDLLDVSRIISGKLRLDLRPASISSVVEAAIESVRPTADAKRIRLEFASGAARDAVLIDQSRMQQVIWNLLSNALKFTPDGGQVTISLESTDSTLALRVADTGAGINRQFLPYVFDRFRQEDAATTRAHGGLGLGLSIVRHLVELHGGGVLAESEGEGMGSAFTVQLPLAHATEIVKNYTAGSAEALDRLPSLEGVHVLLVEDEDEARELVAAVLQRQGARVTCAKSAEETIAALDQEVPDVLLSDIAMPGVDGYELISRIRATKKWSRLPAAALTAFVAPTDRGKALLAGFDTHVPKPVDPAELTAVIAALAGRRGGSLRQKESSAGRSS
ncbi:MAG: response regulator [Acidobacteriota bacterium]|nr:response regulator [Acidobacteriota bacterium]